MSQGRSPVRGTITVRLEGEPAVTFHVAGITVEVPPEPDPRFGPAFWVNGWCEDCEDLRSHCGGHEWPDAPEYSGEQATADDNLDAWMHRA